MSEEKKREIHKDVRQFWLGAIIIASGVTMAFCAFYCDTEASPRGTISGSALGYIGEAFMLGGTLVGALQYVNYKMNKGFAQLKDELQKTEDK